MILHIVTVCVFDNSRPADILVIL